MFFCYTDYHEEEAVVVVVVTTLTNIVIIVHHICMDVDRTRVHQVQAPSQVRSSPDPSSNAWMRFVIDLIVEINCKLITNLCIRYRFVLIFTVRSFISNLQILQLDRYVGRSQQQKSLLDSSYQRMQESISQQIFYVGDRSHHSLNNLDKFKLADILCGYFAVSWLWKRIVIYAASLLVSVLALSQNTPVWIIRLLSCYQIQRELTKMNINIIWRMSASFQVVQTVSVSCNLLSFVGAVWRRRRHSCYLILFWPLYQTYL